MINFTFFLFLTSTVIADYGNTKSLDEYITFEKPTAKKKVATEQSVIDAIDSTFPVSTKIQLSKSKSYKLPEKFNNFNVALIGDNEPSLKWLKINYKKVKNSGVLVVVIDVESKERYEHLSYFLSNAGLKTAILDSSFLDKYVHSYPVLIHNGVVSQ